MWPWPIAGFLSTNDERAPGNYGFLDMIAVLEFVRDQIQYFRGNRDSVTLVGHDAGAMAAGLLTVSPKARSEYLYRCQTSVFRAKNLFFA